MLGYPHTAVVASDELIARTHPQHFGPQHNQGWGGFTVNHAYYGAFYPGRDEGAQLLLRDRPGRETFVGTYWTCPSVATAADAAAIWDRRGEICEIVARHGNHTRLHVTVHPDGSLTVAEYDWRQFTVTLPSRSLAA